MVFGVVSKSGFGERFSTAESGVEAHTVGRIGGEFLAIGESVVVFEKLRFQNAEAVKFGE